MRLREGCSQRLGDRLQGRVLLLMLRRIESPLTRAGLSARSNTLVLLTLEAERLWRIAAAKLAVCGGRWACAEAPSEM
jgi:hypothetical protein